MTEKLFRRSQLKSNLNNIMDLLGAIGIVLVLILTIVYGFFKYSFGYWRSRGIPCDEPLFPYGSIKGLGETVHMSEMLKQLYDKYKPTGAKLCGAYIFTNPIAILFDIELIKCVFVKDFAKFHKNTYVNEIDDPLTANLVLLEGERWKKLRAKLTPTFSSNKMKFMFPTVVGVGERFCDCLLQVVQENDEFEMKELCARFTTDIIGTCSFGIECNSLNDPNAEFRRYGREVFEKPRHSLLFFTLLHMFKNVSRMFHLKTIADDVTAFFMEVVRDTVEHREKNNISRNDFMDLLIKLKNETNPEEAITFNELAAQVFVFFLAGYESSSTTLTCCFYELALNPRIQTKARRIIQEAYKKYNGEFTYEMMMDMPYIDQILEGKRELCRKLEIVFLRSESEPNLFRYIIF